MIKLSKRLQSVADLVDKKSKILVDIGCDHALLDIYLLQTKKIRKAYACDITEGALNQAKNNIAKYDVNNIVTILSDGFNNIKHEHSIDTVVISGMGSSKIFEILSCDNKLKNIKYIIIQSNNDSKKIRQYLTKQGYYIEKDIIVKENNIIYIATKFVRCNKKNNSFEINNIRKELLNNELYVEYIKDTILKNNKIIIKLPTKKIYKKIKLKIINYKLKRMINNK